MTEHLAPAACGRGTEGQARPSCARRGSGGSGAVASAEIYNPATNSWSPAASMASPRHTHASALLPSGKVLVAGGFYRIRPMATAQVYDPATNT